MSTDSTVLQSLTVDDVKLRIHLHLQQYARVVELVDTLALGASASGREGSSPFSRTKEKRQSQLSFFFGPLENVLNLHEICSSKFEVKGRAVNEAKESTEGIFLSERTEERRFLKRSER